MAAVETGESRSHGRGGKKHKKKRRLGIRIDMTPMVDVAFLLLTFFMLTAVFSKPQTMEINLPPDESKIDVAESNLLTVRVVPDGTIYCNMGNDVPDVVVPGADLKEPEKKLKALAKFRQLMEERNRSNPKLITLIKVHREGTYTMMVDIIDELNLANITRFSIAPMLPDDQKLLEKAGYTGPPVLAVGP
jgi:biopolymer transport protein ExbD